MIYGPSISELTEQGHLVPVEYFAPSKPDLDGLRIRSGDYAEEELASRMDRPQLVGDLVENWEGVIVNTRRNLQPQARDLAQGRWLDILTGLGVPAHVLRNKHGPCPMCGGTDRFRWDDKQGSGSFYCNQRGAGDGFTLLMKFKGWNFSTAAREIENLLGGSLREGGLQCRSAEIGIGHGKPADAIKRLLDDAIPVQAGDAVTRYLHERGLTEVPGGLLYHPRLFDVGTKRPFAGMLGIVQAQDGKPVSVHRTFLDGDKKAAIECPRKIMSPIGTINGAAIRLYPATDHVGIAEGIETAIAAHELFGLPVWSAMNANGIKTFEPPKRIKRVSIFGDNDPNYAGQLAAYAAAHRLTLAGYEVEIKIPETPGHDWLDVLNREGGSLSGKPAKTA